MHKITLESEEPYLLRIDGNDIGSEDSDLKRRDHAGIGLDLNDPYTFADFSSWLVLLLRHTEERAGMIDSCGPANQSIAGK